MPEFYFALFPHPSSAQAGVDWGRRWVGIQRGTCGDMPTCLTAMVPVARTFHRKVGKIQRFGERSLCPNWNTALPKLEEPTILDPVPFVVVAPLPEKYWNALTP